MDVLVEFSQEQSRRMYPAVNSFLERGAWVCDSCNLVFQMTIGARGKNGWLKISISAQTGQLKKKKKKSAE